MKKILKVLIVDKLHDSFNFHFSNNKIEYTYAFDWKDSKILNQIQNFDGLILRSRFVIDETFLNHTKDLLFIARVGSGTDGIDKKLLAKNNIELLTAPEGNRNAVTEHTLGLIFSVLNNFKKSQNQLTHFEWKREENRGIELTGKTVGIIGYGNVGRLLSKKLNALGCEVLVFDKRNKKQDDFAKIVTLKELQQKAQIVSIHIPLDDDINGENKNFHFVDATFFKNFENPIFFFNTSRGEVVNTEALLKYLKNGKIKGAGLDVLENEKLKTFTEIQKRQFEELMNMENVILTPHVAGWTFESYENLNKVLGQKINEFVEEYFTRNDN
ncbi:phosphoglycerate dehydrogenase-like oxidoreductase [Bernardetia litoralis DSM 6794]|uniref:Phosphoglycerate dehydrogenase-like oxidoreductase n=1 Tax=Bernardetia litoralis (strain ATCC 23117 / DSM 6794 / NBRC 15988 / NCIMB 1366 / Fx l1 / Sio-4) TaxID=880071 RepID=I4AKN8_BERLS|nr:NAD(P)-dependent oxidoreductase [Bernardetia litoralis]AFM04523.1 phosphoglycerate dehydrogenase-like oxidoreductase [Bernardetia litoralis DSM 6794]